MNKSRPVVVRLFKLAVLLLLIAGTAWVVLNRQNILDWWHLRDYKPTAEIQQIADTTTMVGRGLDMFYVSDPKVEGRETFNEHCGDKGEQGSVLGCYTMQQIYIYKVTDPRLPGVIEVTAAHEMLHAAYDRLGSADKSRIDQLIEAEEQKRKGDQHLQDLIALYEKTEPGEKLNELHSILGTEYPDLSPELETYYKQYFTDRAKVVAMAQGYKGVFDTSKARVADLNQQLDELKKQIDTNTDQLGQRIAEINSESARLEDLRNSDPAAYNQQVPGFNAKVNAYNNLARATQALVSQYNGIVEQVNSEASMQTELNNSLDSNYQPLSTQ